MLDETTTRAGAGFTQDPAAGDSSVAQVAADRPLQTLAGNSAIQFFDLVVEEAVAAGVSERYFECRDSQAGAEAPSLHQVTLDENGVFLHPLTDAVTDPSQTYGINGRKALDAFLDCWIPLPFMRSGGGFTDPPAIEESPSNWARIFIHKDQTNVSRPYYKVVLAIDTAFEAPREGDTHSVSAPSQADAIDGTIFRSSADVNHIGWFVTEPWVDEWLMETFREGRARTVTGVPGAIAGPASTLEHLAHYLTLLAVLAETRVLPRISFLPPAGATSGAGSAVPVDLVIDIGASRTFALLAETTGITATEPVMELLPLRDLTRPWISHRGALASRIEFSRAAFGKEVYSRWSGRTNAFHWPSIARIGTEATRLASEQSTADAFTGLSSPMRYLWDDRASRHVWRFAGSIGGSARRNPLISGPLLALLSETGDLLDMEVKRPPTTKPRFSRSSLLTFFAAELVQHALSAINAPSYRRAHARPADQRQLARLVVTVPSALQTEERAIVRHRIEAAVKLVWHAMDWAGKREATAAPLPEVVVSGEVASHTQLAFLDNEIRHKFRGNARLYFDLVGRQRQGYGSGRSLRIATLDVGGGSSSLGLTTYGLGDTQGLVAAPHLIEGFANGGDDVLKALIETFILPAIEQRLAESKLTDARQFLKDIVNGATHGRASRLGEFRRRFASEIAMPAAIAILKEHEILRAASDDQSAVRTLGDLLGASALDAQPAADEFESLASDEGSDGFHCLGTAVTFSLAEVAAVIKRVLAPVTVNAVRTIRALDCDVVLLSGWLSRLPVLKEALLEGMPIRPDRIIAMHEYRMGEWFPGRSALGNVDDPKSLAAVGALLGSRRPLHIGGLMLSHRAISTPARETIGPIGADGLLADSTLIFDSAKGQGNGKAAAPGQQATVTVHPPMLLGIRRSPLGSWPALPTYVLAFEEIATEGAPNVPLRVTLEWKPSADGSPVRPRIVRATDADGIELATTEIGLRLQTLSAAAGHWLDTGVFQIE